MRPRYFRSAVQLRRWFESHSNAAQELWLGYYKRTSGKASVTWPESVDHALCFGWIDGVRKSIDDTRYMIRFTPRKPDSTWSRVNIKRAGELIEQNMMRPAGLQAFGSRREKRSGIYSYEKRPTSLPRHYAACLRQHPRAAAFFAAQPPSYRRAAIWWVMSAKQEATQRRRLEQLIEESQQGRRLKQFTARKPAGASGVR